jgi:hypothetical protein
LQKLSMTKFLVERGARADAVDLFKLFYCHDILDILFECEGVDRSIIELLRSVEKRDVASLREVKDKAQFSRIDVGFICGKGYLDVLKFLVEECGVFVKGMNLIDPRIQNKWDFVLYLLDHDANPDGLDLIGACEASQFGIARHILNWFPDRWILLASEAEKRRPTFQLANWLFLFESGASMKDFGIKPMTLGNGSDVQELGRVATNPKILGALKLLKISLDSIGNDFWVEVRNLVTDVNALAALKSLSIIVEGDILMRAYHDSTERYELMNFFVKIGMVVKIGKSSLPDFANLALVWNLRGMRMTTGQDVESLKDGIEISDLMRSLSGKDFCRKLEDLVSSEISNKSVVGPQIPLVGGPEYGPNSNNDDSPEGRPKLSPIVIPKSSEGNLTGPHGRRLVDEGASVKTEVFLKEKEEIIFELTQKTEEMVFELTQKKEEIILELTEKKEEIMLELIQMTQEKEEVITKEHLFFVIAFVGVVMAVSFSVFYFPMLKNDNSAIFKSHTLFGVKTDQGWLCPSSQTGLFLSNVSCLFHLEQSNLDSGTFVLGTNGKYVSTECFESQLCLNKLASAARFKIDPINHVLFVHLEDGWTTLAQLEQSRVSISNGSSNKLRVDELFSYSDNLDWSSFEEVSGFVQQIYPGAAAFSTKRGSIGLSWRTVKEKFWKVIDDKDADSVLEFGIALLKCPIGFVRLKKSTYVTAENAEDISKCHIKAKVEEKATDLIVVIGTHVLSAAWLKERQRKEL